jgi:hypothetical protein
MAKTAKMVMITDLHGKVLAAHLSPSASRGQSQEVPVCRMVPQEGQRLVSIDVPKEVLSLRGPCLHQFLAGVKVNWPVEVQLPKINVVRKKRT